MHLQYSQTNKPEKRNFDIEEAAIQDYPITEFQSIYYVAESFQSAKEKLK